MTGHEGDQFDRDATFRPSEVRMRRRIVPTMTSENHEHAERLLLQFARFGSEVSKALADATAQPEFVTNAPVLVLCLLDLDGPARPGEIATVVGLTSGGTTKLLDRMEGAGLIERTYGAIDDDHRGVMVSLTSAGRKLLRAATAALVAYLPDASHTVKEIASLIERIESTNP